MPAAAPTPAPSPVLADPPRSRWPLHVGLLALTVLTTTGAGVALVYRRGMDPAAALPPAFGFSLTLLAILLTHEMGHYVFARIHGIETSLPYVIPVPPLLPGLGLVSFGTLGAVIRMRSPIASRAALIDVGASGPIAGAIVALPLLALGLSWSTVVVSPTASESFWFGHNTGLTLLRETFAQVQAGLAHAPSAAVAHATATSFGDNLLMRLMTRWIFGVLPPGHDIYVHPVATAAWFGLLVTSLNLFPLGQLDGGHVSYAVLGERGHRLLGAAVSWGLLLLAFTSSLSWFLWWAVTRYLLGYTHPPVENGALEIGPARLAISVAALLLLMLTFIPVPMDQL